MPLSKASLHRFVANTPGWAHGASPGFGAQRGRRGAFTDIVAACGKQTWLIHHRSEAILHESGYSRVRAEVEAASKPTRPRDCPSLTDAFDLRPQI